MSRPSNALIVDDEAHARTFLRLVLKELGITTTWEARDGAQALAMVKANQPELVLLDLNMPILGGLEVLTGIQQIQPGTPVIIVTSLSAMKTVQDAAREGAIGYVLKQSPKAEIMRSIEEALDSIEAGAEE
jgi:CheY-like chemotaxis protein